MRLLMYVLLIGAAVAVAFWVTQRGQDTRRRAEVPPPPSPTHTAVQTSGAAAERARLLYGPEAGPGQLLLSSSQLVFTADSGRILVIERVDISGVATTVDLPDRTLARPALVVVTRDGGTHFFEVDQPETWPRRLM